MTSELFSGSKQVIPAVGRNRPVDNHQMQRSIMPNFVRTDIEKITNLYLKVTDFI